MDVAAEPLRHVLWIGGPPGVGKTTLATRIARRHGLRWYSADAHTWEHRDRALARGDPAARRWEAMAPADRLAAAPADRLAMSLHAARGAMVVDDVRRLPTTPMIVAEGSTVPPDLVATGAGLGSHAVWLLPTPELHRARLAAAGVPAAVAELAVHIAAEIARSAARHGAPTLTVDGSLGADETVALVEARFSGALAAGARAATPGERQALLREANLALVAQVGGYHARPWAEGDAESRRRTFLCECGQTGCLATVEAEVRAAAAGPVLAGGRHGAASRSRAR